MGKFAGLWRDDSPISHLPHSMYYRKFQVGMLTKKRKEGREREVIKNNSTFQRCKICLFSDLSFCPPFLSHYILRVYLLHLSPRQPPASAPLTFLYLHTSFFYFISNLSAFSSHLSLHGLLIFFLLLSAALLLIFFPVPMDTNLSSEQFHSNLTP